MADVVGPNGQTIVTARALDIEIRVPSKDQFGGNVYKSAPELAQLKDGVIAKWPDRLKAASEVEIRALWKVTGGLSEGKPIYGECHKCNPLEAHFAGCDFVLWIAADHMYDISFMQELFEPLVFSLLCQIGRNENSKTYKKVGPDFTGYTAEVEAYGMWRVALKELGRVALKQPGLFDGLEVPDGWGDKPSNLSKFPHIESDAETEKAMRQRGRRRGNADDDKEPAPDGERELVGAATE